MKGCRILRMKFKILFNSKSYCDFVRLNKFTKGNFLPVVTLCVAGEKEFHQIS